MERPQAYCSAKRFDWGRAWEEALCNLGRRFCFSRRGLVVAQISRLGPLFMNESKAALRKAYRAHMRSEWWGVLIFTVVLYLVTFSGVALFMFADSLIAGWFFNARHSPDEAPLVIACFWSNLILTIFLIAVAVLYVSGGPAGIPFLSFKSHENDKT